MNEHSTISTVSKQPSPAAITGDAVSEVKEILPQSMGIQCSLTVGAPDDPLEHEADAMADTVMRMPLTPLSIGSEAIQRKCAACEEEEKAQRKPLSASITPFIQTKKINAMVGHSPEKIQKTDWGLLGGQCCNESANHEWALVDSGVWSALAPNSCTGAFTDCDGMTCGGGFYSNHGILSTTKLLSFSACRTPRNDSSYYRNRRWTPTRAGSEALPPTGRGSTMGNTPPGYTYDT